ncbi:MAG: Flp pilus assembly protein CpaB [Bacillota bacterium]|nr:Flp pilus assembly protein CpaB [Bacillota bacterium]
MKSKFILILSLLMGAFTTLLFYSYIKQMNVGKAAISETAAVVIAKDKISKNERITADMLEIAQMPKKSILPQSLKSFSEAQGKIATTVIEKGEPLISQRLTSEEEENIYVSRKVKEGYRAVSIGVDFNQSVSNLIEPEDDVDVVYTKIGKDQSNQAPPVSTIIEQNVRVLAVGRKMVAPENSKDKYVEYSSVTLELKPEDAVSLLNAAQQGKIHLLLGKRPTMNEENNSN